VFFSGPIAGHGGSSGAHAHALRTRNYGGGICRARVQRNARSELAKVAEPKREEEKIFSYGGKREEKVQTPPSAEGDDPASSDSPAVVDASLAAEIQKLRAEKEELLQTLVRRQADFENFRKR